MLPRPINSHTDPFFLTITSLPGPTFRVVVFGMFQLKGWDFNEVLGPKASKFQKWIYDELPLNFVMDLELNVPSQVDYAGYDFDLGFSLQFYTPISYPWNKPYFIVDQLLRWHFPMDRIQMPDATGGYVTDNIFLDHIQAVLDAGCWTPKGYCRTKTEYWLDPPSADPHGADHIGGDHIGADWRDREHWEKWVHEKKPDTTEPKDKKKKKKPGMLGTVDSTFAEDMTFLGDTVTGFIDTLITKMPDRNH
jgi:hypothetical protein